MAFHAGYAASIALVQKTAQEILHIYYQNNEQELIIQRTINIENVTIGIDLFCSEPRLTFSAQSDNRILVTLRFFGSFTFSGPELPTLNTSIVITVTGFCPINLLESGGAFQFSIRMPQIEVTAFDLQIVQGINPINIFGIDINNNQLRDTLQLILLTQRNRDFIFTNPLLSQLKKVNAIISRVDLKLFDGIAVIGVDLENLTTGNFNDLTDFISIPTGHGWYKTYSNQINVGEEEGWPVYDIGWTKTKHYKDKSNKYSEIGTSINTIVINHIFDTYARQQILNTFEESRTKALKEAIDRSIEDQKAPVYPEIAYIFIDKISIQLKDDYIEINLTITRKGNNKTTITTDVHIKMRFVQTDIDGDTAFICNHQTDAGYTLEVFEVNIDEPGWLKVLATIGLALGVVTMGFSPVGGLIIVFFIGVTAGAIIPDLIESIENASLLKLSQAIGQQQGKIQLQLPGTTSPTCTIQIDNLINDANGISAWFGFESVTSSYSFLSIDGKKIGKELVWPVEATQEIKIVLELPIGFYHPFDPIVRIRWEIYADKKLILQRDQLINGNAGATSPLIMILDHNKQEFQAYQNFDVSCRVYRPWGTWVEEVYKSRINIVIQDKLLRNKKYVKWGPHVAFWPHYTGKFNAPSRIKDGTWDSESRVSKIHRTDIDTRCKFASEYSPEFKINELQYFDTLPFPIETILENRHLLCDYCFFGGPDKNVVKLEK